MLPPNSTLLVTGGAGFIGSNFVLSVVQRRLARVVTLDKLTYAGNPENLAPLQGRDDHALVEGDINDRALVSRLLREHRVTAIVNFAAESHVDRSIDGPGEFVRTNVNGTFELLEAARARVKELGPGGALRFAHVSTDEVYGSLGPTGLFTEETPYAPNSPYAASKASADHLVRAYHHTYGLDTVTTNCSNNYGPLQFPEKLIPLVILNALEQRPLPVYGDGLNVRDWLYVEDHVDAILLALARGRSGETYNVGGRNERTNLHIVQTLCATLDRLSPAKDGRPYASLVTHVADRPGHDRRYAIDATKIERELGWRAARPFEENLERTVAWYLDHRAWCERITSGVYRRERLGLETR